MKKKQKIKKKIKKKKKTITKPKKEETGQEIRKENYFKWWNKKRNIFFSETCEKLNTSKK